MERLVVDSWRRAGHWATLAAVITSALGGIALKAQEATHRTDWLPRGHVTINSNDGLSWVRPKIASIMESHRLTPQYLEEVEPQVVKRSTPLVPAHQAAAQSVAKVSHLEPTQVPAMLPDELERGHALPLVAPRSTNSLQRPAAPNARLQLTAAGGDDPLSVFEDLPAEVDASPHETASVMQRQGDSELPALDGAGELPDELPSDGNGAPPNRGAEVPSDDQNALDAVFGDDANGDSSNAAGDASAADDDLPHMVDDAQEQEAPAETPETNAGPERARETEENPLAAPRNGASSSADENGTDDDAETNNDRVTEFNGRDCPEELGTLQKAWEELQRVPIQSISLDITPSIDPNESDEVAEKSRQRNMDAAPSREWRNRRGKVMARGRMVTFKDSKIIVADESGSNKELSWYELGNEELCFVTSWWELPSEFTPEAEEFKTRQWTKITMTWTASAVCHKPLYFEDVQLERYGHSAPPLRQAALSGVHFFGNIFFLPYHLGMNPPNECQYALGYYRPGSCAPWMLPAVPLSARGARMQVSALVGGLTLIP